MRSAFNSNGRGVAFELWIRDDSSNLQERNNGSGEVRADIAHDRIEISQLAYDLVGSLVRSTRTIKGSGVGLRSAKMGIPFGAKDLEALYQILVQSSATLGKQIMKVRNLLQIGHVAFVKLDRIVGEAIDVYVNNCLAALDEVVVEDKLGIKMTEIIKS